MNVVFVVEEGPRQVVNEITISGLTLVDEDVVSRSLRLNVGDHLRTADWLDARRRLFESGLFRRVDILVEPLVSTGDTMPVRLQVNVEEWPALRFRYGFQVAEERPEENVSGRDLVPGVSADVTRRTLFGRAITVGAAGQYERRERLGRLFVSTPTPLRTRNSVLADLRAVQGGLSGRHDRDRHHDVIVGTARASRTTDPLIWAPVRAQPDVRHGSGPSSRSI